MNTARKATSDLSANSVDHGKFSSGRFTAYFDASGHPDNTDVLTVAGFVADDVQWTVFERDWKEILRRADFNVSGLHMKDFCHSTGEYAGWKGNEKRRRSFLSALIGTIKARARHSFANSIYLPSYRELNKDYQLSERVSPLAYCGGAVIKKVIDWEQKWKIPPGNVSYVFADGDKDKNDLKEEISQTFKVTIQFLPTSQNVALEAADLLAYEFFKANKKVIPAPNVYSLEDLRYPIQELCKILNGGGEATDWGLTEKPELEQFCVDQQIPRRA